MIPIRFQKQSDSYLEADAIDLFSHNLFQIEFSVKRTTSAEVKKKIENLLQVYDLIDDIHILLTNGTLVFQYSFISFFFHFWRSLFVDLFKWDCCCLLFQCTPIKILHSIHLLWMSFWPLIRFRFEIR